jgi:ribosomal protein L33
MFNDDQRDYNTMTETLKSNEALSSGYIFDKKKKDAERLEIQKQTEEFYKKKEKKQ